MPTSSGNGLTAPRASERPFPVSLSPDAQSPAEAREVTRPAPSRSAATRPAPSPSVSALPRGVPTITPPVVRELPAGSAVAKPDANTDTGTCPVRTVGAYCRYYAIVSQGNWTSRFYYSYHGTKYSLPPYRSRCDIGVCSISQSGRGAKDIPLKWTVYGNDASIIQMADSP